MADWVGTIVGLYDLAVRVATFANDIRSAQDDFVGLRAEAECLLICINSLNSAACRKTLYKFASAEQVSDLKTLVKNTELNMQDLNNFVAKCWRLVEKKLRRDDLRRRGWRRLAVGLKELVAKTWASYWFAMTDKQPFRDKLVLPAQSINIYLSSLTHLGLVNIRFLIELSPDQGAGISGGRGSIGGGGTSAAGGKGPVKASPPDGWQAVGKRLAFRDPIAKSSDLTADLEEEVIAYVLYLMDGGTPFYAKSSPGEKYKVSKTTTTTKVRTRSRSRSPGPTTLGKSANGKMYVVRKKSISKPSTEQIEIVEREYLSGSDSDGQPRRRLLALPGPDSPSLASGAQFVEIKPASRPSRSSSSDEFGNNGRGPRPTQSPQPSPPNSPLGNESRLHPESARRERRRSGRHPSPVRPRTKPSARRGGHEISREELTASRRRVLDLIQDEADAAVAELEAKLEERQAASREYRRRSRMASRTEDYHPSVEEERDEENEDDILEMCNIIQEEYGVQVVPLPEGARDPIYAPKVRPAAPVPEGQEEAEIRIESREKKAKSRNSKASRLVLEPSESETSEVEDEKLVQSMCRGRTDRLKAETSIPGPTPGFGRGPHNYAYEDPLSRMRSAYDQPTSRMRYEPYPTSPYNRHQEQQRRRRPFATEFRDDRFDLGPDPGHTGMYRHPSHPHNRYDSDDDSFYGPSRPAPKPRGPGPGPPGPQSPSEFFELRKGNVGQEAKRARETRDKLDKKDRERRRAQTYDEPQVIVPIDDGPSQRRRPGGDEDIQRRMGAHRSPFVSQDDYETGSTFETHKRRSGDREGRIPRVFEPRHHDIDVFMSGARQEDDMSRRYESDDKDGRFEIRPGRGK